MLLWLKLLQVTYNLKLNTKLLILPVDQVTKLLNDTYNNKWISSFGRAFDR